MNKKYILLSIVSLVGLLVMISLLLPSQSAIVPKIDTTTELQFTGDGYYTSDTNGLLVGTNMMMSLDFKTADVSKWLLYLYGINIGIRPDGVIKISLPTGGRETLEYVLGKVNDDIWHTLQLKIENNTWTMYLDTRTVSGQLQNNLLQSPILYLGGFDGIDVYTIFKGKMRNVKFWSTPKTSFNYVKIR